jgi:hypothetical protein
MLSLLAEAKYLELFENAIELILSLCPENAAY